jgi:hypothetical protein
LEIEIESERRTAMREDKARMAMKAVVLTLAIAAVSAARAQAVTEAPDLNQRLAAQQSLMAVRMQEAQAKMAIAKSLMEARLQPMEARMAVQKSLMTARLAMLVPMESKMAANQGLLMARLEPLALKSLGMEMQTGGTVARVGQVKDELFAGTEKFEKGASDYSDVNLDPSMMGMIHGGGPAGLAKKIRFMVIHSYEYPKEGMYNPDDVEVYRKKLEDGTWSCSIHVKDKDGTTDICSRATPDHEGSEMVIIAAEKKELTFIHMSGNMSLDELERMNAGPSPVKIPPLVAPPPPPPPAKGQKNAEPVAPAPPTTPGH